MRALVLIAATITAPGCEKSTGAKQPPAPMLDDAAVVPGPPPRLDRPPAPTVKQGGKGDCQLAYAPRPKRDPNPMCKITAGTFRMGSPEGVGRKNERPQRKVTLSGFYIDQFEVTVGQIAYYLNVTKPKTPCVPYPRKADQMCFGVRPESQFSPLIKDEHGYRPLPGTEKQPFDDANFAAARLYCAWVGKQLPTEAQWEYAARHDPKTGRDLVYPWGDTFEPKRANCKESVCKDGFEWEAPVGTFDGTNGFGDGSSPWGVHDMAGNARDEWTADCYTETPRCPPPCRDPTGARETSDCGRTRKSLGGGRDGEAESLRAAVRSQDATDGRTGFRCVRPLVHPSP